MTYKILKEIHKNKYPPKRSIFIITKSQMKKTRANKDNQIHAGKYNFEHENMITMKL